MYLGKTSSRHCHGSTRQRLTPKPTPQTRIKLTLRATALTAKQRRVGAAGGARERSTPQGPTPSASINSNRKAKARRSGGGSTRAQHSPRANLISQHPPHPAPKSQKPNQAKRPARECGVRVLPPPLRRAPTKHPVWKRCHKIRNNLPRTKLLRRLGGCAWRAHRRPRTLGACP
jgi:hypothetical protein